jgi:hypothetical protein
VSPSQTIWQVKNDVICEITGADAGNQVLFLTLGEELVNNRTLESYGVKNMGTLHLFLRLTGGGHLVLFVDIARKGQEESSKIVVVEANEMDTVEDLKHLLQRKEGIRSDSQQLHFGRRELADHTLLVDAHLRYFSFLKCYISD